MHNKHNFSKTAFVCCFVTLLLLGCKENDAVAQQKNTGVKLQKAPKTDFHTAVASGNITAVKEHIAAGTDVNLIEPLGGSSPLITACLYDQKEIAMLLINAGADINFQNNDGSTPLHVAAFFCKPDLVKLLLEKKADKTLKNKYNNTAYEIVSSPFAEVSTIYEQMKQLFAPMGVQMDLGYIEKTRPVIAKMIK